MYSQAVKKDSLGLIRSAIEKLNLNLSAYTVLTEIGSGPYIYTPLIPLLANAKKVYAFTKDSPYGLSKDIRKSATDLFAELNFIDQFEIVSASVPENVLSDVDIITNSGSLRPLDKNKLQFVKSSCVIPLMFESWEIRERDIDLSFCKEKKIKVAGTWEQHPDLRIFDLVQDLAVKLAREAGYKIFDNKIIVWSGDEFGIMAQRGFLRHGAKEVIVTNNFSELMNEFINTNFVFLCDYREQRSFFRPDGIFDLEKMMLINRNFGIVHLYGDVETNLLHRKSIRVYPEENGSAMKMSKTLAHLGLKPIIDLQTAGFKVAQEMLEDKLTALSQPLTF